MEISDILIDSITEDTKRYTTWIRDVAITIENDFLLAGPFKFHDYPVWPRPHDNFHYPLGMRKLLLLGFSGIRDITLKNATALQGNKKKYLFLIYEVYREITDVLKRYSEAAKERERDDLYGMCSKLSEDSPGSFLEACQLYWFSILFRIGTATIGRMDQHLLPFYEADIAKNVITVETARKIVAELLFRLEKRGDRKGDTLQNIMLSGLSSSGEDETNALTYMILELCIEKKYLEPKINVRLHKKSPSYLMHLVSELQLQGSGICTVFNDETIVEGLMLYGRPSEVAFNYCNDGCSEIILDGTGETAFRYIDCVKAVEHTIFDGRENIDHKKHLQYYSTTQDHVETKSPVEKGLKTGSFLKMETFEFFYEAYLAQLKYQVDVVLRESFNSDSYPMRLFTAATMPNVIESACEPYTNQECYHTYGLFIGSLGTAANCIAAIKYLIYDKKHISKQELESALQANFEGYEMTRELCKGAPKFGNDEDYVDTIAADIAKRFASWVREYRDRMGRPILPGLYNHLFHHTAYSVGATPDGRKIGDPVGEHLSPTPGTAMKGPTAVINSVCKINTSEHVFGSTLHLNIPLVSLQDTGSPADILQYLNQAFVAKRGCVLNTNVLDASKLREAQKYPERFKDLIVRVWGFSYYFTLLSREMQDHVIARAEDACVA